MVNKLTIVNKRQMTLPQEIEVYYIIPTIRSYLTRNMKQMGMSQKQIALLLGIRESTVSQYVKSKRASMIIFSKKAEERIADSAQRIKSRTDVIREIQSILRFLRNSCEICNIHKMLCKLPDNCNTSKMGCISK